jgi:hypothetical protein
LHGYRHDESEHPGRGPGAWLARRMGTDRRAEFSSLPFEAARTRLLHGLAILRTAGWQPSGFVAPDWRMSSGTCDALEDLPLRYFSTRDEPDSPHCTAPDGPAGSGIRTFLAQSAAPDRRPTGDHRGTARIAHDAPHRPRRQPSPRIAQRRACGYRYHATNLF